MTRRSGSLVSWSEGEQVSPREHEKEPVPFASPAKEGTALRRREVLELIFEGAKERRGALRDVVVAARGEVTARDDIDFAIVGEDEGRVVLFLVAAAGPRGRVE